MDNPAGHRAEPYSYTGTRQTDYISLRNGCLLSSTGTDEFLKRKALRAIEILKTNPLVKEGRNGLETGCFDESRLKLLLPVQYRDLLFLKVFTYSPYLDSILNGHS